MNTKRIDAVVEKLEEFFYGHIPTNSLTPHGKELVAEIISSFSQELLAEKREAMERLYKVHGIVYNKFSAGADLSIYNEAIDEALNILGEK